jgi:hypothetical protein
VNARNRLDRQKIKRMQRLFKMSTHKGRYDQANLAAVDEELSTDELAEFLKKFPELVCECGCGGRAVGLVPHLPTHLRERAVRRRQAA